MADATKKTIWSNWSGSVAVAPEAIWAPRSEDELADLIRRFPGIVRPAGSGHSFTELCATQGAIVSLQNMTGLIEAWPERQEAEFWAGTPVYAVGPLLHPHGLALANQGDIDRQTLAGATGTGTHGTGATLGSLSSMVVGATLVTGAGDVIAVDADRDPDLFQAARLSLGSLGVVTRLRLKLVPSFALSEQSYAAPAQDILRDLGAIAVKHRHFEFFWFPYADQLVVKTLDVADERPARAHDEAAMKARGERTSSADRSFGMICRTVKAVPATSRFFHRMLTRNMAQGEAMPGRVRWSWETFPSARNTRFNEMEYAVPAERAAEAMEAVVRRIRDLRLPTAFPIEFRFVKGDDVWLSPFHRRDSATISIHQYAPMDQRALFLHSEEELLNFDGRPHWGKQHTLTGREFLWLYPEWRRFQETRNRADPQERFLSPYLRTLFESGAAATDAQHMSKY